MVRSVLSLAALGLTFLDGLRWMVLPGRFLLELVGAAGPEVGKYAVLLSGVFYAAAALVSVLLRHDAEDVDVPFELAA